MQWALAAVIICVRVGIFLIHSFGDLSVESLKILESSLDVLPPEILIADDARPFLIVVTRADTVHTEVDGT